MQVNDQKINFQIQCYVTYKGFLVLYDLLINLLRFLPCSRMTYKQNLPML